MFGHSTAEVTDRSLIMERHPLRLLRGGSARIRIDCPASQRKRPTSNTLITIEMEKLDGIAGQHGVSLLLRYPSKLLIDELL